MSNHSGSLSFGPIASREDFFVARTRSADYASGTLFWDETMQASVRRQLLAIVAWTVDGRTPLLAERMAVNLSWMIARTRESYRVDEPADWVARIEEIACVGWYFECWPGSEEEGRTHRYFGSLASPRRPTIDEINVVAATVVNALNETGLSEPRPCDEKVPIGSDHISTTRWVQWVLLPRLESIVRRETPVPAASQLCTLCMQLAESPRCWSLLYALGAVDELFVVTVPNHEARP